jgi:hypothetical protein
MFEKKIYNQLWQSKAKIITFMESEVEKEINKLDEEYRKKIKKVEFGKGKYTSFYYEYNQQILAFFTIIRRSLFYGSFVGYIDFGHIGVAIRISLENAKRYEKRKIYLR